MSGPLLKGSFIKMRIYSEPDSQAKTQSQWVWDLVLIKLSLGSRSWIADRILGSVALRLEVKIRCIWVLAHWILGSACWILGSARWILGSACWILCSAQWITGSAHPITSLARWIVRAGGVVVTFRPPAQEVEGSISVSASSAAHSAGLQKIGREHGDFFVRNMVVYINTAGHHCRMQMRKSQTLLLNMPIHLTQCKTVRERLKCNITTDSRCTKRQIMRVETFCSETSHIIHHWKDLNEGCWLVSSLSPMA